MRRMLQNCEAYAFTIKVVLILLMIDRSEQGTENSSSSSNASPKSEESASSDVSTDIISEDQIAVSKASSENFETVSLRFYPYEF